MQCCVLILVEYYSKDYCFHLLHSLKSFFDKARDMMYFKRLIQIPKLPDVRARRDGET